MKVHMTQRMQHTKYGMSTRQFTGARVFHQFLTAFADSKLVPRLVPRFPCDYYSHPVAYVDSDDLGTVFRLTQKPRWLSVPDLDRVHWDKRAIRRATNKSEFEEGSPPGAFRSRPG